MARPSISSDSAAGMGLFFTLALASGCGAIMQSGYGFDNEVTRPGTRTRSVRLEGLPDGAVVERYDGHGMVKLKDPSRDLVEYDIMEAVAVPSSRMPIFLGLGVDAAALAGLLYLRGFGKDGAALWKLSAASALVADLTLASIYSQDAPPRLLRYVPVDAEPVTYVARVGGKVYEGRLDAAWSDRVFFDESHGVTKPGAPRIVSAPPRPHVSLQPSPKLESHWYGWQMLPIDAGAATLVVLGVQRGRWDMIGGGAALAWLGPALVHLANGESMHALGSLGLRLGAPIVFGGVLAGIGGLHEVTCSDCDRGLYGGKFFFAGVLGALGLAVGVVLGPIADDAFLSWKETEPEVSKVVQDLVPVAGITPQGSPTFGFAGRF